MTIMMLRNDNSKPPLVLLLQPPETNGLKTWNGESKLSPVEGLKLHGPGQKQSKISQAHILSLHLL
jgi:hypothetical protein